MNKRSLGTHALYRWSGTSLSFPSALVCSPFLSTVYYVINIALGSSRMKTELDLTADNFTPGTGTQLALSACADSCMALFLDLLPCGFGGIPPVASASRIFDF